VSSALLVFGATFLSVFTLGLQSLNVNQGHYLAAGVTSFFISTGHIFLYKYMPQPDGMQLAGYYTGGMVGITASIWFHKVARTWWAARAAPRRERASARPNQRCGRCGDPARFAPSCKRADCPRNDTDTH
jgi:hypothetical protein